MKVTFESRGGFEKIGAWLDNVSKRDPSTVLKDIGTAGERSLSLNTPRDTGATAAGWTSEITTKGSISEVAWTNKAHPDNNVNVAKIIDQGHGTRTGGYVPPRPYIKKSMDSVFKDAGDKIAKGLVE